MKNVHLLCNAHLDPVWLWQSQSGMAEAVSTFRVAADFAESFDGFVFNHNESLLYEWVEEFEPELFERIKKLVKSGRWHIMGGWYLQPDCMLPNGESFIRQIETGRKYFLDKFGIKPTTAINFDSFGHSRGLVQILKKSGYDSYIFMRPYNIVKERDFIWKGYDGSEIIGHNTNGGYNCVKGDAVRKIRAALDNSYEGDNLILWGIGNHGGGPSKLDLEQIEEFKNTHPELNIIHSYPERYVSCIDKSKLNTYDKSMVHCMIGCYTSMVRIKQLHRQLENELNVCEKMLSVSGVDYDKAEMEKAVKAMLFCEFHDILPGTMIEKGEKDSIRLLEYGREIVFKNSTKAFFELAKGQKKANEGELPVMVFNPNPYPIETDVEIDFNLQNQNWNDGEVTIARVYDEYGNELKAQNEKPDCSMSLDWMKKVVFKAKLEPMSLNRFDCRFEVLTDLKRNVYDTFNFKNDTMEISINKETGLIDRYKVDGRERITGMRLAAYKDNEDPWAMKVDGFYDCIGELKLLDKSKANEFNGFEFVDFENVRVIEDGDVRTKVQAIFGFQKSYAVVTYTIPKQGEYVDINIDMYSNDANVMYKLEFDTPYKKFIGQSVFGREELLNDGKEVAYQKWCAMTDGNDGAAILNKGTYGGSAIDGTMKISMLRTPVYSAHPINDRPIVERDRNHSHIDMGIRSFDYRLTANIKEIDAESEIYNQPLWTMSFFASGEGDKKNTSFMLDNKNVLLTRYSENTIHLFNSSNAEQKTAVSIGDKQYEAILDPYEIKAFNIKDGFVERELLETE